LIGPIKVAGLTKKQAESAIKDAYAKDVLVNPSVSLSVYPQPRENGTFVVAGRVEKQGVFEFPKLGDYISILEAIGMAGGFNRYSSRGNVKVRRQLGAETKIYEIDTKAISRNQKAKDFMILPGDSIYVEEIIWFD
jgi:protein involved in polysaccharide export with SLBB domain